MAGRALEVLWRERDTTLLHRGGQRCLIYSITRYYLISYGGNGVFIFHVEDAGILVFYFLSNCLDGFAFWNKIF